MGRGVYLIGNREDLDAYINRSNIAYIQEYLPSDRDIRVVVIGDRVVHSYWRIAPPGEFRTNVAVGATISLDPVPKNVLDLALDTAQRCRWDDVGIDIIEHDKNLYVLEANMKFGKEGFRKAGIDYLKLMESMIENGRI
jgi:ribosomal protein S6--L-glutamate ligase